MKIKNIKHLEELLRRAGEVDDNGNHNFIMITTDGERGSCGVNQGSRSHWIDANGAYHNFYSGRNECDQTSEVRDCYNLEKHLSELWRRRYDFQRNLEI